MSVRCRSNKEYATLVSDNARLEKGSLTFPLRRDAQLFALDLGILSNQTQKLELHEISLQQATLIPGIAAWDI